MRKQTEGSSRVDEVAGVGRCILEVNEKGPGR
jgi:hypothetical protein